MAIHIRTGQPRNGKTQYVIKEIYDIVEANNKRENEGGFRRKIYCDIDGINDPDTPIKLPDVVKPDWDNIWFGEHDDPAAPDGYFMPEYGSVFIFDECHKLEWVKDVSGSLSKNPTTVSLNEHGHAGHDIYLITQFPQYIHTHIRGLVQTHYHVKRKHGLAWARVYKWDDFQTNPRTDKAIADAYEIESFKFKSKFQNAYKSASAHAPIKFTFPAKLWLPIVGLLVLVFLAWYLSKDTFLFSSPEEVEDSQVQQDISEIKADNVRQLEEINRLSFELQELRHKYLPRHIAVLAEHEEVRPAMVVSSSNGSCVSYNSFGEPLAISDSLCYQMSSNPALIPKTRQQKSVSSSVPQPVVGDGFGAIGQDSPKNSDIKYFDSNAGTT